jgi:hypothetical protein
MTRNLWIVLPLLAVSAPSLAAQEALPWLPVEGKSNVILHPAGTLADGPVVEVRGGAAMTWTKVLELEKPKAPAHRFLLSGRIKYEGIAPTGDVRLLFTFSDNQRKVFGFSPFRSGELGQSDLEGTNDWRDLQLPFGDEMGELPEKIAVVVMLSGKGTIYLAPLRMSVLPEEQGSAAGAWWTERQAGLIGGVLGSGVGIMGAFVGMAAGFGFGRRLVLALCVAMIGLGIVCLGVGLVAVILGQPFFVYYVPFLIGIVSTLVFGFNLPTIRRRYDERELRKIAALDA